MNHTPTPWAVEYVYGGTAAMVYARIYEVGHKRQSVGFAGIYKRATKDEASANAQFIVRACNAHYDLVEALEMLLQDCKEKGRSASYRQAESALKLARGE